MSTSAGTSALRAVPASPLAGTRRRPLPIPSVRLVGGPVAAWQQRNGEATIPHCIEQLEVHQFANADLDLPAELGTGTVRMVTGYPGDGRVEIQVEGDVVPGAELSVYIPGWSPRSTVIGPDGARGRDGDGYARVPLEPGARYVLDLDLTPRLTTAHHRVDALRAAVAVERKPVVYCVEQADLDAPLDVDDLAVLPVPITVGERDTLVLRRRVINAADGLHGPDTATELGDEHTVTAIPFSTWGNPAPDRCGSGFRELLAEACNDGPRY